MTGMSGGRWCAFICGVAILCSTILTVSDGQLNGAEKIISETLFSSDAMRGGAPDGWQLLENKGTANLGLEKYEDGYALHLKSDSSSSFGIRKELSLVAGEYPFLNWQWKAITLPAGGDVRKSDTDDQALQLYVAFEATGWPAKLNTPVIGYIWDSECPKGTEVTSPQPLAGKVRYIVLRDKTDALDTWCTEKRNVFDDYRKLFPDIEGGNPRDINGISIMINSQHTKSEAEGFISHVYFSRE